MSYKLLSMAGTDQIVPQFFTIASLLIILRAFPSIISEPKTTFTSSIKSPPRTNYASLDLGAEILASSPGLRSAKYLLNDNPNKYMLVPCDSSEKWIEFALSDDIRIDEIEIKHGEPYSSIFKDIKIEGATHYPPDDWNRLNILTLKSSRNSQRHKVKDNWVKYIRISFMSYYGDEYYCSMTQLRIYGTTAFDTFSDDLRTKTQQNKQRLHNLTEQEMQQSWHENLEDWMNPMCYGTHKTSSILDQIRLLKKYEESMNQLPLFNTTDSLVPAVANQKYEALSLLTEHVQKTELKLELSSLYFKYFEKVSQDTLENMQNLQLHIENVDDVVLANEDNIVKLKDNIVRLEDEVSRMQWLVIICGVANFMLFGLALLQCLYGVSKKAKEAPPILAKTPPGSIFRHDWSYRSDERRRSVKVTKRRRRQC